ncbi:peptidoglycan-binding domain-containing protein [Pseudanabaena sp. PCC 6802]|uniref:peptidoglycan-binding domain-containing protein n=1 Tax=Pseudanabaena sp. PCC 6802 TaxID=118173 RepID=UPI00034934A0|nr:peptidoglycan-binding protein [Pseudanabaena sp. PCC 6802]
MKKPILQQGDKGEDVAELQRLLRLWGLWEDTASAMDGKFDSALRQAVCVWQHRVFLPETGVVDALTWHTLYTGGPVDMPVVRLGTRNQAVVTLQTILQQTGFYWHQVTGEFDVLTDVALRNFQQRCGLVTDGVAGYYTWRALSKLPH